jgi:PhnB protein
MPVSYIPKGFHTVTPYLLANKASALLDFIVNAIGGTVKERMDGPDGEVAHSQIVIGDSIIMVGGAQPTHPAMPTMLYLYVKDTDAAFNKAVAGGATVIMPPTDMFYGDRNAGVSDPFGNQWWFATHIEDLSDEEVAKRSMEYMKKKTEGC